MYPSCWWKTVISEAIEDVGKKGKKCYLGQTKNYGVSVGGGVVLLSVRNI